VLQFKSFENKDMTGIFSQALSQATLSAVSYIQLGISMQNNFILSSSYFCKNLLLCTFETHDRHSYDLTVFV